MYDELNAICDKHGIFLRREAIALGYTDQDLARAVRMRVLHTVRHGSYVLGERWDPLRPIRSMPCVRWQRCGPPGRDVVLSHTTAVVLHDAPTWELPLDDVHLTRRDRRSGRRETGLVQHRGLLLPGDVVERRRHETSRRRAARALDLTTMVDVEHCLPVFDHFLHAGATTKSELRRGADGDEALERHPRTPTSSSPWPTPAASPSASRARATCSGGTGCRHRRPVTRSTTTWATSCSRGRLRLARARRLPRVRRQGEVPQVPRAGRDRWSTPYSARRSARSGSAASPAGGASGSRGPTSTAPSRPSPYIKSVLAGGPVHV